MSILRRLLIERDVLTGALTSFVFVLLLIRHCARQGQTGSIEQPAPSAEKSSGARAGTLALTIFCICLVSRLAFSKFMFESWYIQDDAFDTCVKPLQLGNGEPIWGADTGFIMYPLYWLVDEVAGPNVQVTNAFTSTLFGVSLAVSVLLVARFYGFMAGLLFGVLITISYPFVIHSVYSSAIAWAAPGAMIGSAWLLTRNAITLKVAAILGVFPVVSLYMYPGATISLVALTGAHRLLLRSRWRRGADLAFAGSLAGTYVLGQSIVARWWLGTPVVRTQFAGGHLSFDLGAIGYPLWLYVREAFLSTSSWDAFNLSGPYFEPPLLWVVIMALYSRHRLTVVTLCGLMIAGVLAAFLGPYPGIRRTMWCLPAVYLALATYLAESTRGSTSVRSRIRVALCISLALIGLRSWTVAYVSKPLSRPNTFVQELEKWIATADGALHGRVLVLIEDEKDQYRSHHYWCYLTFRQHAAGADNPVRLVSGSADDPRVGKIVPPFLVLLQSRDSVDLIPRLWPVATTIDAAYTSARAEATPVLRVYRVE